VKRLLVAMMLAAAAAPAHAQVAAAIGKPLSSPDIEVGTVSVRVVAGSPASPVKGTEVTLLVNGAPQVARTDDAGRAFFKSLAPGAQVQAKVADEDGKEVISETFPVPSDGGTRLMLTTRPWNPGAGMAGGAGAGAAGMPNPRQRSGEPRPGQNDPAGPQHLRPAYHDFKDAPVGVDVALVGYHADDSVDLQIVKSDKEGRATFLGLDRTGATSYFAMTLLERNGALDRLTSVPAVLDARVGVRAILSSDKRDSTAPAIDDLTKFEKQDNAPPAGKVRVTLEGGVDPGQAVSLVELTPQGRHVFGNAKPAQGAPDPGDVQGQAEFNPNVDMKPGTVTVNVHGGVGSTNAPFPGVAINLSPRDKVSEEQGQIDGTTDANGNATFTVDPKAGPYVATMTINGRPLASRPFELAASGGVLDVEAHWSAEGKPQVEFDLVPRPGQVFYAETTMHGVLYRSLPFQPVPQRGTRISVFIYPRVLFTFSLTSRVDDEYLAVNGRFEVSNNAWAPYAPTNTDGLIIPLPKGFVGGLVAEKDQADVAIVPGEGFRIVRPLAPGNRAFHGAFSLPVDDGGVTWTMDLPFGSFNSGMEILQAPGMRVQTPPGVNGQTATVAQGTYFVLPTISILPKQSMVMSISGLPQPPGWKVWLPRIVAFLVVSIMVGGLGLALLRKKAPTEAEREATRQKLLDELVELERAGTQNKRREQIMAELESLWDQG